ncbi:MAG: Glu/Leu/Phe/Val dehydrogenase [Leptolyngbya sp. SIO1D8]|nr:Glu/Leu/Phe/Val dehydrogenase [Leptolyngbya sp. SIO1D8]
MKLFQTIQNLEHEQVLYCHDKATGLKAIIALHDTTPGRAMGATRLWPYANETDALKDVLRLSQGMTDKAACANIPVGGAKGVIIAHPEAKTADLLRAYARFVDGLGGRFITGQDVNLSAEDVRTLHQATKYVVGVQEQGGGPAIATAQGVLLGIQAAVEFRWQLPSLAGLKVAVQGLGNVGQPLCHYLHKQGAQLFVSDWDLQKTALAQNHYQAIVVPPDQIAALEVDVFSPCALGGVINPSILGHIKASIIAGCANNQLANEGRDMALLQQKGILYCPDFVINAGGLINVYHELIGYQATRAKAHIHNIHDTLLEIFNYAQATDISTVDAARWVANTRQVHRQPCTA